MEILKPTGSFITKQRIFEFLYADDCVLLATSADSLRCMLDIFDGIKFLFAHQVPIKKSKVMAMDQQRHAVLQVVKEGRNDEEVCDPPRLLVRKEVLEVVVSVVDLRSLEHIEGRLGQEIAVRIQVMHTAFARLAAEVYRNRQIQLKARGHVFEVCVTSVAIYGAAAWNFRDSHLSKLDSC